MQEHTEKADRITLTEAVKTPVWMMVYAAEPARPIDVRMSYADLKGIYDWYHDSVKSDLDCQAKDCLHMRSDGKCKLKTVKMDPMGGCLYYDIGEDD